MCAKIPKQPPSDSAAGSGALIKRLRLAAGMTQVKLAGGRFHPSYISGVECGKIKPSLRLLEWCAERLNVPVTDLVGGEPVSIYDRSQRQRIFEAGYQQAYAEMLLAAGEFPAAATMLREFRARLGVKTPKSLLWISAYTAYAEGNLRRARADLDQYGSPPPEQDNPLEVAAYHWLLGLIASADGSFGHAVDEHMRALATGAATFIAPDFAIGVRASLAETFLRARQYEQAYKTQSEALAIFERLANPLRQAEETRRRSAAAANAGDFVRAARLIRWAETMYREARMMLLIFEMCLRRALLPAPPGEPHTPERDLLLALTIAQRLDLPTKRDLVSALLVLVHLERVDLEQATQYAQSGLVGGASVTERPPTERAIIALAHAALAQAQRRDDEARAGLEEAARALLEMGDVSETELALPLFAYDVAVRLAETLDAPSRLSLLRRALQLRDQHGL